MLDHFDSNTFRWDEFDWKIYEYTLTFWNYIKKYTYIILHITTRFKIWYNDKQYVENYINLTVTS